MMRPTRHSQETTIEFTERELRYLMDRSLARLAFICQDQQDRKSTRLNSSHSQISYAVFCLKKKQQKHRPCVRQRPGYSDPARALPGTRESLRRSIARTRRQPHLSFSSPQRLNPAPWIGHLP